MKPFSRNQYPIRYSRNSTQFIDIEGSLPCSRPLIHRHINPHLSSHSNSLRTILILSFHLCIGLPSSPLNSRHRRRRRHHHHHHHYHQHQSSSSLNLSYDRSITSFKSSSPDSVMQCFLFQTPVSSRFLKVIQ